jgi:hypothetical protein
MPLARARTLSFGLPLISDAPSPWPITLAETITVQPALTSTTGAFGAVTEMPWHGDEQSPPRRPRFSLWRPAFVYFRAVTAYAATLDFRQNEAAEERSGL